MGGGASLLEGPAAWVLAQRTKLADVQPDVDAVLASAAGSTRGTVPSHGQLAGAVMASSLAWVLSSVGDARAPAPLLSSVNASFMSGLWMSAYANRVGPVRHAYQSSKLPVRFPLGCQHSAEYAREVVFLEPLEAHLRNLAFVETRNPIVFAPYRVLPSLPSVKARSYRRRILIDIGANEFERSPRFLIDMYEPFAPFDEVYLLDPHPLSPSPSYSARYKIQNVLGSISIGSGDDSDLLAAFDRLNIKADDFVVLKFDVDEGPQGLTMEWGFLRYFVSSKLFLLVDELFLELHFFWPLIGWHHHAHSMWEAFDAMRQLRACGVAVHAWP